MATRKVTVTIAEDQLKRIQLLVQEGNASSVSAFVSQAVGLALDDLDGLRALLELSLCETGGPMTDAERAWADSVIAGSAA